MKSEADGIRQISSDSKPTCCSWPRRVVVDDVGEKPARPDFTVQEAHNPLSRLDTSAQEAPNTLRTLQRDREVAERAERSLKAVRAGGGRPAAA